MTDIVERLRFDAVRSEIQFSKGVANNIEEAAEEIIVLRAARDLAIQNRNYWQAEAERRGSLVEQMDSMLAEAADQLNIAPGMDAMDVGAKITKWRWEQQKSRTLSSTVLPDEGGAA